MNVGKTFTRFYLGKNLKIHIPFKAKFGIDVPPFILVETIE